MKVCIVCKKEILAGEESTDSAKGPVHKGACSDYLAEQALTESGDGLADTELLM